MNTRKLILVGFCFLSLLAGMMARPNREVICEHNAIYMERCNICVCSKDGHSRQCTTFLCHKVPDGYEISQGPPSWSNDER